MTDSILPALIQQMMQPEFYPHPVKTPIQLIQTHVSYVLLTGDYAYKVKKPVNFGFLDYSTIDKRQHFCQEELRLNQRCAKALYLEVLPIAQVGETFQLGGAEEIADYTLKMRQFPQEGLLANLYDQGKLTEALLQELAKTIARFHAIIQTDDYIRAFGEPARVREAIDENFEQTEKYIGIAQTQAQFDATRAYNDRLFAEQPHLFIERMQSNHIRECHGDLHLDNICLWDDRLWLFDCIEFNEPFRFVDVMYDIAYIVRDLEARDRTDLSTLFLNAYAEQTGDWEGLQVLPFYVNRQAYVRAKIVSFLLDDPAVPEADKQKAKEIAARFYRLAYEYSQPRQGQLTVMCGLSGAGKSTIAKQLACRTGAVHIRSDAVRKHLGGVALEERGGDELYSPEMTQRTYDRLLQLSVTLAQQGYSVILDAKYDRQVLRAAAITAAQQHQLPLQILYCEAPLEVLRDRLQKRTGDIADATADLLPKQFMEPFAASELPFVKTLNTTQAIETLIQQVEG
ncbi:AAA family ATPase [Phormidium tenue FACHB-886]|nr:AAA family ATPase [Phormidium tenue FACHB-886]